jgi:hypothetical protein
MDRTSRLALPFLAAGQTGKEFTHNEALARLDIAVAASVGSIGANSPPASPVEGECHIVGTAPGGAWAGQARAIAGYTGGGWRFVTPVEGMTAIDQASGQQARFAGGAWVLGELRAARLMVGGNQVVGARQAAIGAPSGGTVTDSEARTAIGAILAALRSHGLIAN